MFIREKNERDFDRDGKAVVAENIYDSTPDEYMPHS